jgi:predicted ATPase/class 3 adenylate cyclase/Tfp pilus assembly protein PilF
VVPPSGQVTFLFTDIEGSTKLAQVFHDKLPEALLKHNFILREATETNSGFVFRIIGDAFCCAFETSDNAIKAAVDAQMKLHAEVWGDAVIKVRMGIHSGYAEWSGTDYMGYITLARVNRVMSAAYGGQVLVSFDAHNLSDIDGLGNISFRDLGERRLKDLIQPMKLYQIISPGMQTDFPPLNTLDARPNNLPVQLTSFIGREKDLSELKKFLSNSRLVTLLGSGGTGKTRLALQASADIIDEYANGVWFADLSALQDPLLLPQNLEQMFGISERPKQSPAELLAEFLRDKELLIILDNCEHLIEACASLSQLILQQSLKVKILATSRESLRCNGELVYKVGSLNHPEPNEQLTPEQLTQYEAVRLFIERALAVNPSFRVNNSNAPALAQICSQLDGIPLALELAAVRTKVLSLEDICTRLENRFALLTGGKRTSLPRQKTLRAMIDWSFDLLSENERILWRRLSVFSGGWTLEVAEQICSDELIDQYDILDLANELAEKSVISFSGQSGKFRMLETIRQYGAEKLKEANETYEFCQRHFNYYLNLCEGSLSELSGPRSKYWMDIFEEDYPNIQNALRWAVEKKLMEEGNRLAYTLGKFWEVRGHIYEGKSWLDKLLNNTDNIPLHVIANSKRLAGVFATILGDNNEASRVLKEALAIFRDTNNKDGISQSLNVLGMVSFDLGDYSESKKYLTESLALKREGGTKIGLCSSLNSLGLLLKQEGDYGNALKYYEEALELAEELKDEMYLGILYNNIAEVFDYMGDFEKSKEYFEKGIEIDRAFGNKSGICVSLYNIAQLAVKNNDFIAAEKFYAESVELAKEIGFKMAIVYSLVGLGNMALEKGDTVKANEIYVEILRDMRGYSDQRCIVLSLAGIAQLKMLEGEYEESCILLGNIRANCESAGAFIDRDLRESLDKIMGPLNIQLGESTVNEKIEIGKAMDFEKIIEKIVES